MELVTTYQLWRHQHSNEVWAVRLEHNMVTGVCGPLPPDLSTTDALPFHDYDDDPDQAEWLLRYQEEFSLIG
jgi:hypothetical protein